MRVDSNAVIQISQQAREAALRSRLNAATNPVNPKPLFKLPEPAGTFKTAPATFEQALKEAGLELSKHAGERIQTRQLSLHAEDALRIGKAVQSAQEKGSRNTLVLDRSGAFLVSVRDKKILTALDRGNTADHIFTNIDSTVITPEK